MRTGNLRRARLEELCELVTDGTHDSPKIQNEGIPFIKGKNISGGTVDFTTCDFIKQEDHELACKRVKPQRGDILFSNIGSVGDTAVVRDGRDFSIKNVALFRPDKRRIDGGYFYYLVLSPEFRSNVMNVRSGSAQPFISLANLRSFEVNYDPTIATQRRIASILSAYDDLIENSQRRIKILESMARALYREWFVHFRFPGHENHPRVASPLGEIPEGWEVKKLGDICSRMASGGTPKRSTMEYWDDGEIDWYKTGELWDGFLFEAQEKITARGQRESTARLFEPGTILMAIYGSPTVGRMGILTTHASCNQAALGLVADKRIISQTYLYFILYSLRDHFNGLAQGAAQQNISKEKVSGAMAVVPSRQVLDSFDNEVVPIFEQVRMLQQQIQNLRRTRDLLLPRLLSGQIALEELEAA
jgi:type I restriction enzyme S subunit